MTDVLLLCAAIRKSVKHVAECQNLCYDFGGQIFKYAKEIFLWSAKIAVQIFRTVSFFAQTAARAPKTRNSVNTAARSSVPTALFAPRAAGR